MTNQELVITVIKAVFINKDITAFDKYFNENYIQRNPQLPNGTAPLKQFIPTLSDTFGYEPDVVTQSGDIIMIHGRYEDWGGEN